MDNEGGTGIWEKTEKERREERMRIIMSINGNTYKFISRKGDFASKETLTRILTVLASTLARFFVTSPTFKNKNTTCYSPPGE
jgi:hypothetical protein